jgi:hypothetical protein
MSTTFLKLASNSLDRYTPTNLNTLMYYDKGETSSSTPNQWRSLKDSISTTRIMHSLKTCTSSGRTGRSSSSSLSLGLLRLQLVLFSLRALVPK